MIQVMISLYLVTMTLYNNDNERKLQHDYDEERERVAILFEEEYFYTQGKNRGRGKSGGKKGGRSTKSKFSEKNLITFHKRNDKEKKKRKARKTLNEERKYLQETTRPLETRYFKKGQEINLCPQELNIRKQEKQFMTRNEIITQEKNEEIAGLWVNMKGERIQEEGRVIFENGKEVFLSREDIILQEFEYVMRKDKELIENQHRLFEYEKQIFLEEINTKIPPLEIDLVYITLWREQIASQIKEFNIQLNCYF